MLTRIILLLLLLPAPAVAGAQPHHPQPPHAPPHAEHGGVIITATGVLAPGRTGELAIAPALVERVAREPAFAMLDTHPEPEQRVRMVVRFVFADVASFNRWYADAQTTALLRDLAGETMGQSFELLVSMHRPGPPGAPRAP